MSAAAIALVVVTAGFLAWERIRPGRALPHSAGWYVRSLSINACQLATTLAIGAWWHERWRGASLLDLAATGECFYHANMKTPGWLRYFVQTPELHSIHHQYDFHACNYGDLPIRDRLFATYRDTVTFTPRCGFPDGAEQRLGAMLAFRDVYEGAGR